jgi:hypothetical protein
MEVDLQLVIPVEVVERFHVLIVLVRALYFAIIVAEKDIIIVILAEGKVSLLAQLVMDMAI